MRNELVCNRIIKEMEAVLMWSDYINYSYMTLIYWAIVLFNDFNWLLLLFANYKKVVNVSKTNSTFNQLNYLLLAFAFFAHSI